MNPDEIERVHNILQMCGITDNEPIKVGSSAIYLPSGQKVGVVTHFEDDSDHFYSVRMPDGTIRDTTHNRLIVSHNEARKTMELMFQLRKEIYCEKLYDRHQQLKNAFKQASGSYLSKASVKTVLSELG